MELLYFFESIRIPGLNEIMLLITRLGEETAFLVAALIVFWCVDKRKGYYVMSVGFIGTMANQMMKLASRVPRPWVKDPNFTILEQAKEAADGYSFPSGHSQSAVGTFGAIARFSKNAWVKGICVAAAVLVPISRMYVGVHTPADVLVGSGMALILVWLLEKPILRSTERCMPWVIGGMLALSLAYLLYVELWPFPQDMDPHNMESGLKNAYTLLGCILGIAFVYPAEVKWVKFDTKAVWWAQLLKAILGLTVVLLVKEGLREPLLVVFGGHYAARACRYFLDVVTAGLLWPMTFRWFSKLGVKKG